MHASTQGSQQHVLENYLSVLLGDGLLSDADTSADCGNAVDFWSVAAAAPVAVGSDDVHILPFNVVGLALAMEKASVAAVLPWPATGLVAPSHGCVDEILGALHLCGRTTWVLDTAKLVVPAGHPGRPNLLARRRYSVIVLLKDSAFALACDAVDEEIIVDRAAVQWRSDASQYGWMKASMPAFGYALLDPEVAAQFRPTT